jgi:uncharacterized phage-associated protein
MDELRKLQLLSDDHIDTSDIPETIDWSNSERGRFSRAKVESRTYDVRGLANWFIHKAAAEGRKYTNLSLNKLVYIAFERSLVDRSVELTQAKIEAWQYGPVFREIYHAFKDFEDKPVDQLASRFSVKLKGFTVAKEHLLPEDEEFLNRIYEAYGKRSAGQLVNISHARGGPWWVIWSLGGPGHPGMEITRNVVFTYAQKQRRKNERR